MNRTTALRAHDTTRSNRDRELRTMLLARRRDLVAAIRDGLYTLRAERAADERGRGGDDGDVPCLDVQEDIELVLVQMKRETLGRIDSALERLDQGRYGRCAECGDDITPARLRALPFAVRCLGCEDAREADALRQRLRDGLSRASVEPLF